MGLQSSPSLSAHLSALQHVLLFQNRSNVCFANSVLQALFAVPTFQFQMLAIPPLTDPILSQLKQLAVTRKSATSPRVVSPLPLLQAIRKQTHSFQRMMHHDAHEFLLFLLNYINEKASVYGLSKDLSKVYQSIQVCETVCAQCSTVYTRQQPSMDLSLPIRAGCSLNHCVKAYLDSQQMEGVDQYDCQKCKQFSNASRRIILKKLPQILPVHLRRFSYNSERLELEKLDFHMAFPKRLHLCDEIGEKIYALQAIVIHLGRGVMHGHYICLARKGEMWIELNDESIREASPRDIFRIYGGQQICAYMLIYRLL